MVKAFEIFQEIQKLQLNEEKQRAWLKQYEGKHFSIGKKKRDIINWKKEEEKYVYYDSRWSEQIKTIKGEEIFLSEVNKIQRHDRIFVIEFDDIIQGTDIKDKKKIKENIEKVKKLLEENKIGYIESTHNGNSNYIWIEYERELIDKDLEEIIKILAPKDSEVDINFSSSNKRFPVLFASHWKYGVRELPVNFFEGEKLTDEVISKISIGKKGVQGKGKNVNGYKTYNNCEIEDIIREYVTKSDLAEQIWNRIPYFYDKSGLWWLWNEKESKWERVDDKDILIMVKHNSRADTISSKEKGEVVEAMIQYGREKIPKKIIKTWIQFKDEIYDVITGEKFKASPEYFVTNPIPYKISGDPSTPIMDKIFTEWVGKDFVKTLHEIIAYCLIPDYPIHRLFCFIGAGLNGKSCFLNLLKKFIGESNVTSTELDVLLTSRFEITRLYKKLVCIMGETNFSELSKTSIIKKLTGQDTIGYEYKNKNPFEDMNYAKILIATNNLPTTTDKTIGFYRRWLIIDFPNQFSEKKDILADIPEEEYSNLATECICRLNELLGVKEFHNEGNIEERTKKYEDKSNFFDKFWKESIIEDSEKYITVNEFEKKLSAFCKNNHQRMLSAQTIHERMTEKGIEQGHPYMEWYENDKEIKKQVRAWMGITWK